MSVYKDFAIFIIAAAVIWKSADFFTDGAAGIARVLRIPRFIIGLTIVSLATTAPEFTVSTFSSYMGVSGMAVGNAVGSCIANIALALAAAVIVGGVIHFDSRLIKQELRFLVIAGLLLFLLMSDSRLGRGEGLSLCVLLIVFFAYLIGRELRVRKRIPAANSPSAEIDVRKNIGKFLIGALGVIASAKYGIIPHGINIARFFKVPEVVIGLSLVAVATSLPELFTALVAARKKMGDIAAGNVVGANILNVLWVLGVSSVINPLTVDAPTLKITLPVMIGLNLLLFLFVRTDSRLLRRHGFFLLLIYLVYLVYLFRFAY